MSGYYQSSALKRSGPSSSPRRNYKFLRRIFPIDDDLGSKEEQLRKQELSSSKEEGLFRSELNFPKINEIPQKRREDSTYQRLDIQCKPKNSSSQYKRDYEKTNELLEWEENSNQKRKISDMSYNSMIGKEKYCRNRSDSSRRASDLKENKDVLGKQQIPFNTKEDFEAVRHDIHESFNLEKKELPITVKVSSSKRFYPPEMREEFNREEYLSVEDCHKVYDIPSNRKNESFSTQIEQLFNVTVDNCPEYEIEPNFEKENLQHCYNKIETVPFDLNKYNSYCQSDYFDCYDSCIQSDYTDQYTQQNEANFSGEKDNLKKKDLLNNTIASSAVLCHIIPTPSDTYELIEGRTNENFQDRFEHEFTTNIKQNLWLNNNLAEGEISQRTGSSSNIKPYENHTLTDGFNESEKIRKHNEYKENDTSNTFHLSTSGIQIRERKVLAEDRSNETITKISPAHFPERKSTNEKTTAAESENVDKISDLTNNNSGPSSKVSEANQICCSETADLVMRNSEIDDENINNLAEEMNEESRMIQQSSTLRVFDLIDETGASDSEEGERQQEESSDSESAYEEVPLDELDSMLDEQLPDRFKHRNTDHVFMKRKVILEEIGYDHFDLLPEGWIQIMHASGMPVYLHQKTRVCSMARPYYLGPGSSRNHKVPLSAIPCLQYRRALEEEKKTKAEREKSNNQDQTKLHQSNQPIQLIPAEIETTEENLTAKSLEALELREYCKKIFNFKTKTLIPFKSWADRRKYSRMAKDLKKRQRPTLPGGTKLLKFPIQSSDGPSSKPKREWIINPNGKSYVCILHEYVQHALKKHPNYKFKELENPANPYSVAVFIDDIQYSIGMGASKKEAKAEAAKAALEVLIPEMRKKIDCDSSSGMRSGIIERHQNGDLFIFDQIKIEDPRVAEFCTKTAEPLPYAILLKCLSRNLMLGEIKMNYEMNSKKHKEDEFTMEVGNRVVKVLCKNKRDGKQRAAQAMLQALHPNITYWGSLLRMYGNGSIKNVKEKKQEEQEITGLQSKALLNQPNFAILNKLKTEMKKIKDKTDAIKAKGKFIPPPNINLPSLSSSDLNKVNIS